MMTFRSAPASAQRGRLPGPSGPAAPRRTARPGHHLPATPGGYPPPAARPRPAGTPGAGRGPAPPPAQRPRTGRRSAAARSPATTAQQAPHARPSGQVHMTSLLYRKRFCRLQHAEQGNCSHPHFSFLNLAVSCPERVPPGRPGRLRAEVQLDAMAAEPAAAVGGEHWRLGHFPQVQHPAVEVAQRFLTAGWAGQLT